MMTVEPSLLENLLYRRVPQIVGMYIATTWLVIELGDWVTERFNFPANVTSYVFVAMLIMLPAVILFAYNHGAPGKDRWTAAERTVIPLNIMVALGTLYFVSPQLVVEAATETVQIPDETGVIQEFEVARQGYHKEVIGFFWRNETDNSDLDWLSYGLPMMLAHDLNRVSPVVTALTPFDSSSRGIRNELRNKGHASFLDEPQGLQVEIARNRRSAALIVGSFSEFGESRTIRVSVIDARNGEVIGSHSVSNRNWLPLVDDVSDAVLEFLDVSPHDNQSNDPVSQHFSSSLAAIQHFTRGQIALDINNNYPVGIAEFRSAVEVDPGFAEAASELSYTHYLNGDTTAAQTLATEALKNSYRLSETSKFVLKANRYIFDGDFESGERVLDVWAQVQPNSTEAFDAVAQIAKFRGSEESLIKASAAYDRILELDPMDFSVYQKKAEVEQQRGDFTAATAYLRSFLDKEPDDGAAHLQLANLYQAQGDLDAAQASMEEAAILSDDPLRSELGLARLDARRGSYTRAETRLSAQLSNQSGAQQRLMIISTQAEVAVLRGQIAKSLALQIEMDEIAKEFMPPMIRMLRIRNQLPTLLTLQGKFSEAIELTDEIIEQLQPPQDSYLYFNYATIYGIADDRMAFREWAARTRDAQDQIPDIFQPFIEMNSATIAIWDEDFDAAIAHLDDASNLLGQSLIQLAQDNLSTSSLYTILADLYLQAGAIETSQDQLTEILRVFPANAQASLIMAKTHLAEGNSDSARQFLTDALDSWTEADADYIYHVEAEELLDSL